MKARRINKILCMATLAVTCAAGCGKTQTAETVADPNPSVVSSSTTVAQELPPSVPVSGPVSGAASGVIAAYPDADNIQLIGNNLFVIVNYNYSEDSTDFKIYDSSSNSVVNEFSVPEVSASIVPDVIAGQGFGVSYDYTKNGGNDNGIIGYYYSIKDDDVTRFTMKCDRDWNTWYHCAFAPDGSAMYVKIDDRSICACGYNFNPDFKSRLIAVYADARDDYLITEYDHHTVVEIVGTSDDGRLLVAYTEDPNDYPKLSHEEFERGMGAVAVELEISEDGTATFGGLTEDLEDIEMGLAFLDPAESSDHNLEKIHEFSGKYYNVSYRNGSIIYNTDEKIVRLAPDGSGNLTETQYDIDVPDDVEYTAYDDEYVSPNGDYVVFSTNYKDNSGSNLYVVHFDNDKAETVLEKANDDKKIDLTYYYGPIILDEATGEFFAQYDDTTTDNWEHLPYQINIAE